MNRKQGQFTDIYSFTLYPEEFALLEKFAKKWKRSRSSLVREAIIHLCK